MDIKLFEIRDGVTCSEVMAIRLRNRTRPEFLILRRAGYAKEEISCQEERTGELVGGLLPYIVLVKLTGLEAHLDHAAWLGSPVLSVAHRYISEHWATLASGDVLTVVNLVVTQSSELRDEG